ncbi:MAG: hypothetical protein K9N51_10365 [Candidatus Pacebacteria bacterium]|nr:hypothetical protein [Candidatus Paceibacterota bacterium]
MIRGDTLEAPTKELSTIDDWHVEGMESTLTIFNRRLRVAFRASTAWTISHIAYRDVPLVGPRGFQGTVITLAGKGFVGTGHGGEDVRRLFVRCDGREQVVKAGLTLQGKEVTLVKESVLGPLEHRAEVVFPAGEEFILYRYVYHVRYEIEDLQRMYVFMHCVDNTFDEYMVLLPDSTVREEKLDRDDGSFSLGEDVKSVVYYNDGEQVGMAFVYPEVYSGARKWIGPEKQFVGTFIWDRKYDNKLYFNSDAGEREYALGDEFAYHLKLTPFTAGPEEWTETGKRLSAETGF